MTNELNELGTGALLALYEPRAFAVSRRGRRRHNVVKKGSEATTWPRILGREKRTVVALAQLWDEAEADAEQAKAALAVPPPLQHSERKPSATGVQAVPTPCAVQTQPLERTAVVGAGGRDSVADSIPDETCLDLMLTHRSVSCLSMHQSSEVPMRVKSQARLRTESKVNKKEVKGQEERGCVQGMHGIVPGQGGFVPAPPTASHGRQFERSDKRAAAAACRRFVASSRAALSFFRHLES